MRRVRTKASRTIVVSVLVAPLVALALLLLTVAAASCGTAFSTNSSIETRDADANDASVIIIVMPPAVADAASDAPGVDATSVDAALVPCEAMAEPNYTSCSVTDASGVFVSTAGTDGTAGTMNAPLRTITAGIAKASVGAKRVFVCAGAYDEHLSVGASQDGVAVYGGFDCTTWTYQAINAVKVTPSTTGYALEVDTLTVGATFEDLEFDAQSAQLPGDSSIAVFANQSIVTFTRVVIKAGDGSAGAPGDARVNYATSPAPSGNDANGETGGPSQTCTCLNGDMSVGGAGGSGGTQPSAGAAGAPTTTGAGQGGDPGGSSCTNGNGGGGAMSADAPAVLGATTIGRVTASGWSPASGADGNTAFAAQGGGGGSGNSGAVGRGGGGSGGCGGCGGSGGTRGFGGGSAFALLSFQSTITIEAGTLTSANAQNGGQGGLGQIGQTGGITGNISPPGCQGGTGGTGGGGSGGGGGAGGVSAAIGYVGNPPTQTATITNVGNLGAGGRGGVGGGANNAGGNGKDGMAIALLLLPEG